MIKNNNYSISNFICQECGNGFPLPRQNNRKRNKRHIKDLWCPHCKKVVKTTELREDDFFYSNGSKNDLYIGGDKDEYIKRDKWFRHQ